MPTQSERLETAIDTLEGLVDNTTGTGDMVLKTGAVILPASVNGNTITTGTGTLTLGSFTLVIGGNITFGAMGRTLAATADAAAARAAIGASSFDPISPGPIGFTTPAAARFTDVAATSSLEVGAIGSGPRFSVIAGSFVGKNSSDTMTFSVNSATGAVTCVTLTVGSGTLVMGGNVTFSGAYAGTFTLTGTTTLTLPTTGTLATTADITNNGVGLQNAGRKYKIISGFLSHTTGVGWSILNDANHEPMGVDVGTALTLHDYTEPNGRTLKSVRVTFTANTGLTGAKVVSCTVGSYEDMENGIRPLPNIGTTNVTFHMHQHRTWRTRVYYDGSAWQRDTNGDCSSVTTSTFSADGILPVYRQKSLVTNQYGYAISNKPGVAWHRDTTYPWIRNVDQFKPFNTTTGAVITTAATTLDCEIVRHACGYIDANDTANFPGVLLPFTVILSFD